MEIQLKKRELITLYKGILKEIESFEEAVQQYKQGLRNSPPRLWLSFSILRGYPYYRKFFSKVISTKRHHWAFNSITRYEISWNEMNVQAFYLAGTLDKRIKKLKKILENSIYNIENIEESYEKFEECITKSASEQASLSCYSLLDNVQFISLTEGRDLNSSMDRRGYFINRFYYDLALRFDGIPNALEICSLIKRIKEMKNGNGNCVPN